MSLDNESVQLHLDTEELFVLTVTDTHKKQA